MQLSIAFEHLARVDGSASFGFGQHAQATASISGPIEVRIVAEQPSKATLEVAVRPISGVAATDSKAFAATISSCILPCCILTQNPRTLIQLVVQARLVCNKDTLLASMINASTLALINAGSVPLRGVVCAVPVGRKKDEFVVDEVADIGGCFAFMFTEGSSSCVWANWRGEDLIPAREFASNRAYQKDETSSVSNRDILQRLNFMYQASTYLNNLPPPPGKKRGRLTTQHLSKSYIESMKSVGKRTTVKMDPSVKRTLCKGCDTVLVPGSTATVRTKASSNHKHIMTYTCTTCQMSCRIPAPPITGDSAKSPPLFARDGHTVLVGNERLEEGAREGVFIT